MVSIDPIPHTYPRGIRRQVRDYLMTEQIEINPLIGAPRFLAFQYTAVKLPRCAKIVNGKSQMERIHKGFCH